MGQTIGFEFDGDITGWPKKESPGIQVIVSDYADHIRDNDAVDFQFAVVRGAVHGGSKSSESHDHITVRFTTIDEQRYDAHIAVDGHYGIDYNKCQLWKK